MEEAHQGRVQKAPTPAKLLEMLQSAPIFRADGKLITKSDPVWNDISRTVLKGAMSPSYIWQYLHENRWDVADVLRRARGLENPEPPAAKRPRLSSEPRDAAVQRPKKKFLVTIPAETWSKMKPVETVAKRPDRPGKFRHIWRMPPEGWSGAIVNLLWEQHFIPCPLVFKRAQVHVNNPREHYVDFEDGTCSECGAEAKGHILIKPDDNQPVQLVIVATDTREIPHKTRRQLRGQERRDVGQTVKSMSCSEYRRQEGTGKTQGAVVAPTLYSEDVLRKAKQETKRKELGLPKAESEVATIVNMKYAHPFLGSIHIVGFDPILVWYCTPTQMQLHNIIVQKGYSRMSMDATGSLVERLKRPDEHLCGHVMLFQVIGNTGSETVPLNQLLSERQDSNTLAFWLNESLRRGARVPNEMVSDDSPAIINALSRSVAGCSSAQDYKSKCFLYLMNSSQTLPRCYLRKDLAHFINNARKWPLWTQVNNPLVKKHCLHFLGLLIDSRTLKNFQEVLEKFLTILYAATIGRNEDGEQTLPEKCHQFLVSSVSGLSVPEDDFDTPEDTEDSECPEEVSTWLQGINEAAVQAASEEGDRINPYACEGAAKKMLEISKDFMMWSSVMVEPFKSPFPVATSAHNEGSFSDLKRQTFQNNPLPQPLSSFVAIHLRSLGGQVDIAAAAELESSTEDNKIYGAEDDPDDVKELREVDNWRGKATRDTEEPENHTKGNPTADQEVDMKEPESHTKESPTADQEVDTKEPENHTKENPTADQEVDAKKPERQTEIKPTSSKYINKYPEMSISAGRDILMEPRNLILRNGNLTRFQTIGNSQIQVRNTCAFDSFVQIIAVGIIENPRFRAMVEATMGAKSTLRVAWILAHEGANGTAMQMRTEVASKFADLKTGVSVPRRRRESLAVLTYDMEDSISAVVSKLDLPFLSEEFTLRCSNGHEDIRRKLCLDVNSKYIMKHGIGCLQDALIFHSAQEDIDCRYKNCAEKAEFVSIKYSDCILIDTGFANKNDKRNDLQPALKDFPTKLEIAETTYDLVGIVAYTNRHFTAYAKRLRGVWEQFNDIARHPYLTKEQKQVTPHLLVYLKR
ncbi:hypothetical protein ONE63_011579 [Megalurothrips usitatus]|uniref:Uncharacterized protein n=1 Tax=Megalurothrips usitatus TaxID=439358 RepID=A0AAV7X453_9NEOP|nr:hypothetical protein ONE63_011579 [Megalurothrips usitatus]